MQIYRAYKYIYYRIYIWNRMMWGDNDFPEYNGMFVITILSYINLASIPTVFELLTGVRIFAFPDVSTALIGLVGAVIMAIHYSLLVHGEKFKVIVKEFSTETQNYNSRNGWLVFLYIVGSIIALFGSWILIYFKNNI